jgi:4-hydroxy-tetrahydrodipicolinate synthase
VHKKRGLFMFAGTFTALVTPFRNDQLDEAAFAALIEAQVAGGVTGVVPVGTTGESPTLSHDEHLRVIELAVQVASGRVQVMAGTGSNSTKEAIEYTQAAERLGANSALIVAPYYNKPTQEGIYRHFRAIAEATKLEIMLYSIPARCGVEIAVETCVRLATDCPNIVAIKEAGGKVERVTALRAVLPPSFEIMSGDDGLTLPFVKEGANGVVSVASNIIPREVGDLVGFALAKRFTEAQEHHDRYTELFTNLFVESNPAPIKQALAWQGRMTAEVRLPLVELQSASQDKLRSTLKSLKLV